jgi:hypothetical protein
VVKKIIVYDFDKTLTMHDTLFGFFRHASKKSIKYYAKLPIYIYWMILSKFGLVSNTKLKEIGVAFFLQNLSKETLMLKAKTYKQKIVFNNLYNDLEFKSDAQYFIVSASFEEYLQPLFSENVTIIGSKLKYKQDQISGLLFNCYKDVKKEVLEKLGISQIDLFYTDSYSDLALVTMSRKTIIVDKDKLIECDGVEAFKRNFGR